MNPYWSALDQKDLGKKSYTITNGFDHEEFNSASPNASNKTFTILALGNISFASDVDPFFMALRELVNDENLDLTFQYRGFMKDFFVRQTLSYEVGHSSDIQGLVDRLESVRLMRSANLLVIFSASAETESDKYLKMGYYPGKVFEFMASGTPILCVPGDDGLLDSLLKDTGTGVSLAKKEDIKDYIRSIYKGGVQRAGNQSKIAAYSRERQTKELAQILDSVLL